MSREFYQRFDTRTLRRVRVGFEFRFDRAHDGGEPTEWITNRIALISALLDEREPQEPGAKAYREVEAGNAKPVLRWNRKKNGSKR